MCARWNLWNSCSTANYLFIWFIFIILHLLSSFFFCYTTVLELSAEIATLQTAVLSTRQELKHSKKHKHEEASATQLDSVADWTTLSHIWRWSETVTVVWVARWCARANWIWQQSPTVNNEVEIAEDCSVTQCLNSNRLCFTLCVRIVSLINVWLAWDGSVCECCLLVFLINCML